MKVFVQGEPEVTLGPTSFVAEGGEGKVFVLGDTGYKIYHDPARACPVGKMDAFRDIDDDCVIAPRKPVFQAGRTRIHVGHTFRFVRDTWTLCQLFPRAFRDREGLDGGKVVKLVQRMREAVEAVHRQRVLIVDMNEMNVLVRRDFAEPYFIDVDSYQTPRYPATAIMDSVRDPRVQGNAFTELSDWWSFAIITFQLFIGIHPFKGKHPTYRTFDERTRAGISVLDPQVTMPRVCYPLDVIPSGYRAWYEALFVAGKRAPPPQTMQATVAAITTAAITTAAITTTRHIQAGAGLDIRELHTFDAEIRMVFGQLVHVGDNIHDVASMRTFAGIARHPAVMGTAPSGRTILASLDRGMLALRDMEHPMDLPVIAGVELAAYAGVIYVRNRDKVLEIMLAEVAGKVMASSRVAASVLEHASHLYEGVVLQNVLGVPHAGLFPRAGSCYQHMLPQLKGHKVLQAKFDCGVLMVLTAQGGKHHRFVFRFDRGYQSFDVRHVPDVTLSDLNFVSLDSGVCVCLNEEEKLEVFSSVPGSASVRIVEDPALGGDMRLVKDGGRVMFYRGCKLYSMRMR